MNKNKQLAINLFAQVTTFLSSEVVNIAFLLISLYYYQRTDNIMGNAVTMIYCKVFVKALANGR